MVDEESEEVIGFGGLKGGSYQGRKLEGKLEQSLGHSITTQ